jgi:arylformamidase
MPTYPTDPRVEIKPFKKIPQNSSNVSRIVLGSHTGTHVDTKLHIQNGGWSMSKIPLDSFYGKCKVLDLTHCEKNLAAMDLERFDVKKGDIILLKTKNSLNIAKKFGKDCICLAEDAADYLVERKIKTVGIDCLSIGNKEVHKKIINSGTIIFESLDLSKVKQGEYIFVGLPLKIDCDGAPARAILIEI